MADEISKGLIAKVSNVDNGELYDNAVETGTKYWISIINGKGSLEAKKEYDDAMSKLVNCSVSIDGTRMGVTAKILRAIYDSITTWY